MSRSLGSFLDPLQVTYMHNPGLYKISLSISDRKKATQIIHYIELLPDIKNSCREIKFAPRTFVKGCGASPASKFWK
jgi:hypothetical protein